MTSSLKKGLRGAMTAGAEMSLDNFRASLDDKKMEKMQRYQTSERLGAEAHDLKMQKLQNDGAGGGTQGDIQLMNYFQEKGIAKTPEEARNMVREMDSDPQKIIVDIAKSMYAADPDTPFDTHLKQAETDLSSLRARLNPKPAEPAALEPQPKGGPRKGIINSGMSVDSGGMIDQALDSAPAQPPTGQLTDTAKIQTDDDYAKLKSGTRYIAPDGKVRIKK